MLLDPPKIFAGDGSGLTNNIFDISVAAALLIRILFRLFKKMLYLTICLIKNYLSFSERLKNNNYNFYNSKHLQCCNTKSEEVPSLFFGQCN